MSMKTRAFGPIRFSFLLLIFALSTTLTACKKESNFFTDSNASEGNGGGSAEGVGFRLRLKAKSGVSGFLHKFGDTAASCEIALSENETPTSIQCLAHMMEYDLWFYGFEYEVNVPAGFCQYLVEQPNYYYSADAGVATVAAAITTEDGRITACTADGLAGTIAAGGGSCTVGEGTFLASGAYKCAYDHTSTSGVSGPNCCEGKTTLTLTKRVSVFDSDGLPTGGFTTTVAAVESESTGKYTNCLEAAHNYIDGWPKSSSTSKALAAISELGGNSSVRSLKVPSPLKLAMDSKRALNSNVFLVAGMHDWAAYAADSTTWDTARAIPRSLAPLRDRGPDGTHATGTALPGFDGSYEFQCLGAAGELKHRIRLYMTEWNIKEDYDDFVSDGDAAAESPARAGDPGVDCVSVPNFPSCNTRWGFEDLVRVYGAGTWAYPTEWLNISPE